MRTDILTPAQQAVQSIHAAIEMARQSLISPTEAHPHLVLVVVPGQAEMDYTARLLDSVGILYRVFVEPDIGDQTTALCTQPLDRNRLPQRVRKHLRGLVLFGAQSPIS